MVSIEHKSQSTKTQKQKSSNAQNLYAESLKVMSSLFFVPLKPKPN
jgi:hypothetical protein